MSVLSDIMTQEQLQIRDCFEIDMGEWVKFVPRPVVVSMRNHVLDELEKLYGGADFINEDFFPTIYNDIPGLMFEYMYKMGHITSVMRDNLLAETKRAAPYWGVPEVPSMSVPIQTYHEVYTIHTYVENRIWENRWKGTNPIVYHRFLRYMNKCWKSNLQFCHNPNPWKVLEDVIANPGKYAKYEHIM